MKAIDNRTDTKVAIKKILKVNIKNENDFKLLNIKLNS